MRRLNELPRYLVVMGTVVVERCLATSMTTARESPDVLAVTTASIVGKVYLNQACAFGMGNRKEYHIIT